MFQEEKPLRIGAKLSYGVSYAGGNIFLTLVGSFVLLYLTDTVGLNSGIVGTLMLVAKVFDGISDIFFGSIIDRTHSKYGKAKPWIFRSIIPLAICEILLFSTPSVSQTLQYAYFFIIYTVLNAVFFTMYSVSINILNALMTKKQSERVQISVLAFIINFIAVIAISSITLNLVDVFGSGVAGWRIVAIIYSVVAAVLVIISTLFIHELPIDAQNEESADAKTEKVGFGQALKHVASNKYYVLMLIALIVFALISTSYNTTAPYYAKYILENTDVVGVLTMAAMIPMIVGLLITPILTKRFSLYLVNTVGSLLAFIFSVCSLVFAILRMFIPMTIFIVLRGLFSASFAGTQNVITAQIADYSYLKNKIHIEGSIFSCTSFGSKVGSGVATALVGWLLELGGYVGTAAVQTDGALTMIIVIFAGLPTLFYGMIALLLWRLDVEKATNRLKETVESERSDIQ